MLGCFSRLIYFTVWLSKPHLFRFWDLVHADQISADQDLFPQFGFASVTVFLQLLGGFIVIWIVLRISCGDDIFLGSFT